MHQTRFYRQHFNTARFRGFTVSFHETDLWIGTDPSSYRDEMKLVALETVRHLREKLDDYIFTEPAFARSLVPFVPAETAPAEAKDMAAASSAAGIGPMASVAGLFARAVSEALTKNFSVNEMVIENGGDIFARLCSHLVLAVYAGSSPLSGKIGLVVPEGMGDLGICTSSATVGPSLSLGKADAAAVVCRDVLLADAFATALCNMVKQPADIDKALEYSEEHPEILAVVIICGDKLGMRGSFEMKLLKDFC